MDEPVQRPHAVLTAIHKTENRASLQYLAALINNVNNDRQMPGE